MSHHFFTFPEIKISNILTQLTKTASIIYQEITLIFCISAAAYINYAHSHHWLKIVWCILGYIVATEITKLSFDTFAWKKVVSYLSLLSCTHAFRAWGLKKTTKLYLNVLNNFLNSKLNKQFARHASICTL